MSPSGLIAFFLVVSLATTAAVDVTGLRVKGNVIVNGRDEVMALRGVSHSGTEYMCVQGYGIFDGPANMSLVGALQEWNVSIVRVPMNEDCWLGINGVLPQYAGYNYQSALLDFVNLLTSHSMAVILDLHWTAPGSKHAIGQKPMPDMDHSVTFWSEVAETFKNNSAVIFDLFNEPYPHVFQPDSTLAWSCWKNGSECGPIMYEVAGMDTLVAAVRATGATNILMLGGTEWSNKLDRWLEFMPADPLHNLAASFHCYNLGLCNNAACWNDTIAKVSQVVPVITGELGEYDCRDWFVTEVWQWLDNNGPSTHNYLAWTFNNWECDSGPSLISDWSGTPTAYGAGYKEHLLNP